jgi:hypothetical protein
VKDFPERRLYGVIALSSYLPTYLSIYLFWEFSQRLSETLPFALPVPASEIKQDGLHWEEEENKKGNSRGISGRRRRHGAISEAARWHLHL